MSYSAAASATALSQACSFEAHEQDKLVGGWPAHGLLSLCVLGPLHDKDYAGMHGHAWNHAAACSMLSRSERLKLIAVRAASLPPVMPNPSPRGGPRHEAGLCGLPAPASRGTARGNAQQQMPFIVPLNPKP